MARKLGLKAWVAAAIVASGLAAPTLASADDAKTATKAGVEAKAAFARLKTLAGDWKAEATDEPKAETGEKKGEDHKREGTVIFKVTGAGSALVETTHPGTNHEMVSVYHLDGDDLKMTHYCAAQNQPHVKLDRANSTPDQLIFVFDGGTNLDPEKDMHIHGVKITFHQDGKVTSAWEGYINGKKAGTTSFFMTRQTGESGPGHVKSTTKHSSTQ